MKEDRAVRTTAVDLLWTKISLGRAVVGNGCWARRRHVAELLSLCSTSSLTSSQLWVPGSNSLRLNVWFVRPDESLIPIGEKIKACPR